MKPNKSANELKDSRHDQSRLPTWTVETSDGNRLRTEGTVLWQEAASYAAKAHAETFCPGTDEPYFSHPSRVAMLVSTEFGCTDAEVLAAAYLHDVVEKSSATVDEIEIRFGPRVAEWVAHLSKDPEAPKGTYWTKLHRSPWQVRLIKIADALDHLHGPLEYRAARLKAARKASRLVCNNSLVKYALVILEREIMRLAAHTMK